MIKINLKPSLAIPSGTTIDSGGITDDPSADNEIKRKGLTHILLMLIIPTIMYIYGMQVRPQKVAELASVRSQVAELYDYNEKYKNIALEIQKIQEDEKNVQTRIDALSKVTQGRFAEVKILDLLQSIIRDRMWLKKIEITDGKVSIEGMAQSEIEVNSFLEDLTKNVLFSRSPRLAESAQEIYEGQPFSKFRIEGQLEKAK